MIDYKKFSKAQLIAEIDRLKGGSMAREIANEAHLVHELQVHQIELEMQNRELREAQQEQEEAIDRYADLFDFAPVGYLMLDETGRVLEINLTAAVMLGRERARIVGKAFSTFFVPGYSQLFRDHLRETYRAQGNVFNELKIKGPGGGERDVRLESVVVKGSGERHGACRTVMTDITEQKRMAWILRQSRSAQEALLNTIPAMVFYKNLDLQYIAISKAFADFLGCPAADVIGKSYDNFASPELANDEQRIDRSILATGKVIVDIERQLKDAGGNPVVFSTSLAPYNGPNGKVAGLVGVWVDITSIREAEQRNRELLWQNRSLTRRLFSLQERERRYLARELHDELSQWLTAIQAEAEAIGGNAAVAREPKILAGAQAISESATQVHQVIRRMLHRLRPGLLDELGLADSLREMVAKWRKHHPSISCDLVLEGNLADLNGPLNITVYRIVQEALTNVASHAEASQVSVRLRRPAGEGDVPNFLLLSVEDNGKGIDSRGLTSSGLGMLGMRERVIAADGDFRVSSAPGQGTRIDVQLRAENKGSDL